MENQIMNVVRRMSLVALAALAAIWVTAQDVSTTSMATVD